MKRLMHDILDLPQRAEKPRKKGLTMVIDIAWFGATSPLVAAYRDYFDCVKSTARCLWVDEDLIRKNIKIYRDWGIDVQIGGIPYEIAVLQGKQAQYMERARALGTNIVEVESHAAGLSLQQMKSEVKTLKGEGFKVVGEVGAKWANLDETRPNRDSVRVDQVIEKMQQLLEVGADHVIWEGMVVRALLGNHLENKQGQEQLFKVVEAVSQENIIFEMWSARGNPNSPLWGWLVQHFGPDVNLGNINIQDISMLETIRRGLSYDPAHPYIRWLSQGRQSPNWWEMESPDYKVDLPG
jgi:phosphosulfolactate synthase